ncbi:MAG: OmpA family protein [Saprospiraceae bacterium]|nr:OmpA family protein [Saprospiraceae bacterium]
MRIFYLAILFIWSCATPQSFVAQQYTPISELDKKHTNKFNEARALQRQGKNVKAIEKYDEVLKKYPNTIDAILAKSGIYFRLKDFNQAESMLLSSIKLDPEYNEEVYYSLALVNEQQGEYSEAVQYMTRYLSMVDRSAKKRDRAVELKTRYEFIAEAIKNPVPFDPIPLPDQINTEESEYTPGVSADGSEFYFVRRIRGQEDILVSYRDSNSYGEPFLVEEILSMDNEGVFALSADGRTLIFTGCNRRDGFGSCDLYYSRKNKYGGWSTPSNMGPVINSPAWESQPSLSADGTTLYFASRRLGSIGNSDIWKSEWTREEGWSNPENIGGMINTTGSDETPFIHPDGKTLYFRSDGRVGIGKFDLYMSRYDEDLGAWDIPVNLGYPINTRDNEGGLTVSLDGTTAFYSSDQGKDNVDIYQFELYPEVRPFPTTYARIQVTDSLTGAPLEVDVVIDNHNKQSFSSSYTDAQGMALVALVTGNNYGLTIEKDGYLFYSRNFRLDTIATAIDPILIKASLLPLEKEEVEIEKPIVLNNIFFESGSAILQDISMPEIQRLTALLRNNLNYNVTIIGHTDDVGSDEDNLQLSSERAKAVYLKLIEGGISQNRVTYVGKGENEPIATNETPQGRQTNRRTEFLLTRRG